MPRSKGADLRGQIPDLVSIRLQPPEADDRVMPDHWEGDVIEARTMLLESRAGRTHSKKRLVHMNRRPDFSGVGLTR
jgi:hypothetical protein